MAGKTEFEQALERRFGDIVPEITLEEVLHLSLSSWRQIVEMKLERPLKVVRSSPHILPSDQVEAIVDNFLKD